ncbi:MAG: hypothetical protein MCSN_2350 [Candidatus Microsyncoccus archaeolyticus]|jgi:hypothetical protein|nr:MAG: hypothetical protein MCSN_2350 [Candidatus Parcubacteria bacterium]
MPMGNGREKRRREEKKKKPSKIVKQCQEKTQGQKSSFRQRANRK